MFYKRESPYFTSCKIPVGCKSSCKLCPPPLIFLNIFGLKCSVLPQHRQFHLVVVGSFQPLQTTHVPWQESHMHTPFDCFFSCALRACVVLCVGSSGRICCTRPVIPSVRACSFAMSMLTRVSCSGKIAKMNHLEEGRVIEIPRPAEQLLCCRHHPGFLCSLIVEVMLVA